MAYKQDCVRSLLWVALKVFAIISIIFLCFILCLLTFFFFSGIANGWLKLILCGFIWYQIKLWRQFGNRTIYILASISIHIFTFICIGFGKFFTQSAAVSIPNLGIIVLKGKHNSMCWPRSESKNLPWLPVVQNLEITERDKAHPVAKKG